MPDLDPANNVGDMLASLRGDRPLSDVAQAAGLDPANLLNVERKRRPVGRKVLHRILAALAVAPAEREAVLALWSSWGMDVPDDAPVDAADIGGAA